MKLLPTRANHNCFGCSPLNPSGLQMKFHTDGEALYSWVTVPSRFPGWKNLVHGGVITTILDEIMGWSTIYLLKTTVLTKSLAVDFLRPVYIERELRAEGRVVAKKSEREAEMEGRLFDSEGNLCSRARGTFALFTPELALRRGVLDRDSWEELKHLIET